LAQISGSRITPIKAPSFGANTWTPSQPGPTQTTPAQTLPSASTSAPSAKPDLPFHVGEGL
jgi:hypothetical protein